MADMPAEANWFTYFPGEYRWSSAVCFMVSCARWGASEIGEVDRVGRRLASKTGDDEAWFREWVRMAGHVRALGMNAEQEASNLTAAAHHLRACVYYQMGGRFRTPKDRRGHTVFKKSLDSFHRFARLSERPRIECVEIPYENGASLPAYLVHAENTKKRKPPVVVFFDGLDNTKELVYVRGVESLVARGMSCLVVDGPGSGEAARFRNLYLRHDYEVAGSAALDYLETRGDVNARRAAIIALSAGGYYAPRAASMDSRYKACVAWGAIWDYHATWKRRLAAWGASLHAVPDHHILWIMNAETVEEALHKLEGFRLDGVVQKMRCPFLLVHGAEDRQIPMRDARKLFNAVGSEDKTFKVFTSKEGGAQHCQRDNMTLGTTYIYDWLREKLRA